MMRLGLDLGSVNTKLVVFDGKERVYSQVVPSRFDSVSAGKMLLASWREKWNELPEALHAIQSSQMFQVSKQSHAKVNIGKENQAEVQNRAYSLVVTGYGRVSFPEGKVITEITCQARGCHEFFPEIPLILDVGGQDAKVIRKNSQGKVTQFVMNDKCAAGTGRFLDVILKGLELTPKELAMSAEANPVTIDSMCTVFAESEVITLLAKGVPKPEVIAGLFQSTAKRLARFVESLGQTESLIFAGGGAHYELLVRFLEQELKCRIVIPPEPELTVAMGAAMLA